MVRSAVWLSGCVCNSHAGGPGSNPGLLYLYFKYITFTFFQLKLYMHRIMILALRYRNAQFKTLAIVSTIFLSFLLFGFSLLGVARAEITAQNIFGSVLRRMLFLPQPTGSRKPSQAFYSVRMHTLKETS